MESRMEEASRPLAEALIERPAFDHTVTLRDHADAAEIITEFLREHEGEITPEIEALIRDNEAATKDKIARIGWFLKQEDARMDAEKELVKNLQRRITATANRIDWLKRSYLADQLARLGLNPGDSIKGTGVTVRIQLNNPALKGEVNEDKLVDMKLDPKTAPFVRYVPERYELDRKVTLDVLKHSRGIIAGLKQAQATLDDPVAKQKDKDAAVLYCNSIRPEDVKEAMRVIELFPELDVVREPSVRIA